MMLDLLAQPSQQAFGDLVGVSQQAVADMLKRGVISPGDTMAGWLSSYCGHLREAAAGRSGSLVYERARLAAAQADRVELQNRVARSEYAHIDTLGDVLSKCVSVMVAELDQIDGAVAMSCPDLPEPTRLAVLRCVTDARNKVAAAGASLTIGDVDPSDDIDAKDV